MRQLTSILLALIVSACNISSEKKSAVGNYAYDVEVFQSSGIEFIDMASADGQSRLLITPCWQGRVMTSTADGLYGRSNGWVNHPYIKEGKVASHMHAIGGEERIWIGPEGGPYSYYFNSPANQVFDNWQVPAIIDTDAYTVVEKSDSKVKFEQSAILTNASGHPFNVKIERTVELFDKTTVQSTFGVECPAGVKFVGYETVNTLTNTGSKTWEKETGLPCVWSLCMLNSSPKTTLVAPFRTDATDPNSVIYNGNYFGDIPADRITVKDGVIYFKADADFRSKFGIPAHRAKPVIGSYDSASGQLTILTFNLPSEPKEYVNGIWNNTTPYEGDVVNGYNDGLNENGGRVGNFYEIESSSPAAALQPNETITHIQTVVHFIGSEAELNPIAQHLLGVNLSTIKSALPL